ncbi:MAG: DsbA family oxidoreductase [Actinobacteria bacterium]|nr:DsbA family oxidoreductase [Actinomycetota bacterium]
MKITIFLDTICGWCYIGHNRLFKALAEFKDKKFEVHYAPFLLNPNMPLSGMKRSDYLEKKFGSKDNAQPMYDNMTKQAALEGLNFNLNKIKITPSTVLSHILIDLSKDLKEQKFIVENIFRNYFIDGCDIGNIENLMSIGIKNGLNKQIIEKAFKSKKNTDDYFFLIIFICRNKWNSLHKLGRIYNSVINGINSSRNAGNLGSS